MVLNVHTEKTLIRLIRDGEKGEKGGRGYGGGWLTSTETIRLIRDREEGGRGYRGGGEGDYISIATGCHNQNDSCIKMGSDENHFNRKWWTKSQDSVHKPQPFWRERRADAVSNRGPSAYQPNALPLGQTGSLNAAERVSALVVGTADMGTNRFSLRGSQWIAAAWNFT